MTNLYYVAPDQQVFDNIKEKAIELWNEVATNPEYAKDKVGHIKDIKNVQDNFMYIFAMFDPNNQFKLIKKILPQTAKEIAERLMAGEKDE